MQAVILGQTFDPGQDVQHFPHAPGGEPQNLGGQRRGQLVFAELLAGQGHVRSRAGRELHYLGDAAADLFEPIDIALYLLHADQHHRHLGPVREVAYLFQHSGIIPQRKFRLVHNERALALNQHAQGAVTRTGAKPRASNARQYSSGE